MTKTWKLPILFDSIEISFWQYLCYDNHVKGPVKVWKKSIMPFLRKVEIAITLVNMMMMKNNNKDPVIELRCS